MKKLEHTMEPELYHVEKFLLLDTIEASEASLEYMQEKLADYIRPSLRRLKAIYESLLNLSIN